MREVTVVCPDFYSEKDEEIFFQWLGGFPFIGAFDGAKSTLIIEFYPEKIERSDHYYHEFRGLLRRYGMERFLDEFFPDEA